MDQFLPKDCVFSLVKKTTWLPIIFWVYFDRKYDIALKKSLYVARKRKKRPFSWKNFTRSLQVLRLLHYLGELFITGLSFTQTRIVLCNKGHFPLQSHVVGCCI